MQALTKSRWATALTIAGFAYVAFVRLDMWVGHFTFWDNFKDKVLPALRGWIWPMLTTDNLAWVCFLGGAASLVWMNFGDRIAALCRSAFGMPPRPDPTPRHATGSPQDSELAGLAGRLGAWRRWCSGGRARTPPFRRLRSTPSRRGWRMSRPAPAS